MEEEATASEEEEASSDHEEHELPGTPITVVVDVFGSARKKGGMHERGGMVRSEWEWVGFRR